MQKEIIISYEEMHKKHPKWYKDFQKRIIPSVREKAKGDVKQILNFSRNLKNKKRLELLDIGAGFGGRDIPFLREFSRETKGKIFLDCLDPSKSHSKKFKENLNKEGIKNLVLRGYHITDWRKFGNEKRRDLILSFHSWYGIYNENKERNLKLINKLLSSLKKDGVVVVFLGQKDNLRIFMEHFGKLPNLPFNSKKFHLLLKEFKGIISLKKDLSSVFDITDCIKYKKGNNIYNISKSGKNFISYCLSSVYDSFSEEKKKKINDFLLEKGYFQKERFYLKGGESLILFRNKTN